MRMQTKISIILMSLITGIIFILSASLYSQWFNSMQKQVALDARDQAVILAEQADIRRAMTAENGYLLVNKAVENIQIKTGIQYLYILNNEGRYFAHPLPERLNTYYKEGDTKKHPLLEPSGYHYGHSGDAMVEAYAPIYTEGVISGVVVIGIYNGRILQTIKVNALKLLSITISVLAFGLFLSYLLTKNIKKAMKGLEPEGIALLLSQQETILEQMGEGLLATDPDGKVILINENAKRLLKTVDTEMGKSIAHLPFYRHFTLRFHEENAKAISGEWRVEAGAILKVDVSALSQVSSESGFLFKLDDMSLVLERAEELTNMKQLTQALRAQNHEFMNKLHTVSGLIQLEAYSDALRYIESVTKSRKEMVEALNKHIKSSVISGLLLAKYSYAAERHVTLILDEEAHIERLPMKASESDMTSLIGNLIDNAIEAIGASGGEITVDLYHDEASFYLTVSDNGPGMSEALLKTCFNKGMSTKGEDRGYGLSIVKEKVQGLDGSITLKSEDGLCIQIVLPM